MRVRWSKPSKVDLHEIQVWIRRDNPAAAQIVAEKILKAVELIASHSAIGKPGRISGTREFVIAKTPFLIVYGVPEKETLAIFRIFHGARKWSGQQSP